MPSDRESFAASRAGQAASLSTLAANWPK